MGNIKGLQYKSNWHTKKCIQSKNLNAPFKSVLKHDIRVLICSIVQKLAIAVSQKN